MQGKTKTMSSLDDENSNSHISQQDNLDDFNDDYDRKKIIDEVETGLKQLEKQYKFQFKNKNVSFQLLEKKEGPYKIQIKIEEDRKYIMRSILQLNQQQPLLYINTVTFKQDNQRIIAESEYLTQRLLSWFELEQLQPSTKLQPDQILACIEYVREDITESFNSLTLPHVQPSHPVYCKFDPSQLHNACIPYPPLNLFLWGPQGHLGIIQNKNSLMHQTLTDQTKLLQTQKEIYNYIYRQKKLKNIEDNKEQSKTKQETLLQDFDDEYQIDFMQIGAKLIAEAEEDNYDYLNFDFQNILTYQPDKKDQQYNPKQKQQNTSHQENNVQMVQNYEFYEFNMMTCNFPSLLKKIEQEEKKPYIGSTITISIYDLSNHIFNLLDPIQKINQSFVNDAQIQNKDLISQVFKQELEEYFNIYKSEIMSFIFDGKKYNMSKQRAQMQIIQILFKNILQSIQLKLQTSYNLHLTTDVLLYWALCWENQINRFFLQDQFYQLLLQIPQLPELDNMLNILKRSLFDTQIIDNYIFKQVFPYFNEHLSGYLESNLKKQKLRESMFSLQSIQDGTKCSQWFKKYRQHIKNQIKTIQNQILLKQLPLLNYINIAQDNDFSIMIKYLRILNPQLAAVCLKQIAQNNALQLYVKTFNKAIHYINFNQIEDLKQLYSEASNGIKKCKDSFECSVCQLPISKGMTIFCMQCNHGGHQDHILNWFSKNKQCPQCFKCHCLEK